MRGAPFFVAARSLPVSGIVPSAGVSTHCGWVWVPPFPGRGVQARTRVWRRVLNSLPCRPATPGGPLRGQGNPKVLAWCRLGRQRSVCGVGSLRSLFGRAEEGRRRVRTTVLVLSMVLAGGLVSLAGGALAAPSEFSLTFVGKHVVDPAAPTGLHHEGQFTASAPFCSSGTAIDTRHVLLDALSVERTHTCDDGSGSIIVSLPDVVREHQGGGGSWKIIGGTGKYEELRGSGAYSGQVLSGDPFDFSSVTYRTIWRGLVGFDADPPAVTLTATATKLKLPRRTYSLRVGFAVRNEEPGARVTYSLIVQANRQYVSGGSRQGSTTAGRAAFALRITPPRTARTVQISVRASDPLGNESTTTRPVRLP
jgi:hypothetical protein